MAAVAPAAQARAISGHATHKEASLASGLNAPTPGVPRPPFDTPAVIWKRQGTVQAVSRVRIPLLAGRACEATGIPCWIR